MKRPVPQNEHPTSTPILPGPFIGWLTLVYLGLVILIIGGGHLGEAIANWPISTSCLERRTLWR